jgi:hypothetical protein
VQSPLGGTGAVARAPRFLPGSDQLAAVGSAECGDARHLHRAGARQLTRHDLTRLTKMLSNRDRTTRTWTATNGKNISGEQQCRIIQPERPAMIN